MSALLANLMDRAGKCPFACFLKILTAGSFIFALHIAIMHQADVSPYPFILLVALVGLIGVLAAALHFNCRLSNTDRETN
ncbi:MAG: hypothetical protein WBN90_05785 [Gammaproteobacteria bacterium]